ncbi:MAG: S8 family serine peptidase, partial [Bacteroidales bacterium]|nr:S8 family serine peptidase [Bacteroidales bacterium]
EVEFAHEPVSIVFHDAPNDPDYESSLQWNLAAVNAEGAWELTHGSSSVKIGIVDEGIEAHPDLLFGGNTFPGDHGTWVAGVAGARTDNETGIASLGWGVSIYNYGGPFEIGDHEFMAERILDAIDDGMDIINMSWGTLRYVVDENDYVSLCPNCSGSALSKWLVVVNAGYIVVTHSYPEISYAISDAHELGIICISSAGNSSKNPQNNPNEEDCDPMWPPFDDYPSKYLGVIGVSATWLLNDNEEYIPNWNYGDFVDLSAPGYNIWTTDTSSGYTYKYGTSFSAPLVSALTGLIITLDPNENVFEILKNSTDKVDSDNHPYDGNGWNQYLGYGRINAYKALKAVFPNPPNNLTLTGSVGGHPTIHWDANVEPDLDGYNIYSNYDGGSYQYLTSVDKYTTSFTDPGAIVGGGKFAPSVCYKVSAFDVAGNESDLPWRATCTKVSGISKQSAEDCDDCIPIQTVLHNAYPNPFNPKTNISFDLKNDSFVNLSVYNIKGQIVSTLVNSSTPAGYHHIPFRGDHLPSGVYIYKVVVKSAESNSNYQAIKRMLLLK